jgi:hypothetical protein
VTMSEVATVIMTLFPSPVKAELPNTQKTSYNSNPAQQALMRGQATSSQSQNET